MKKLLISMMLLVSYATESQTSTSFTPFNINWLNMSSGTFSLYSGSILTPQPSTTDNFSGTSVVNFTAAQYIDLEPGFNAGGYSAGGNFVGQIGGDPITDAEVMGFTNQGYQYQRFEIGVNIENTAPTYDYITQINTFLADPINPNLSGPLYPSGYLNPYDPDQVKIKAVFTNANSGDQFTRFGYYQQYVNDTLSGQSYNIQIDPNFPFRVRFAPPQVGTWTVQLYLYINDALAPGNQPFVANFDVQYTTNRGNVGIDPSYPQFFAFQDNQANFPYGTPTKLFFPVGQANEWAMDYDPHLVGQTPTVSSMITGHNIPEEPNNLSYTYQRSYIHDLAANGGNFTRISMAPWSNGIEWGTQAPSPNYNNVVQSTICNYRQDYSWELDNTLTECENDGIYVQLCLEHDGYFYNDIYAWCNKGTPILASPYYYLLGGNVADALPTIDLIKFFNQPIAWKYYEKKLFYVEARWGYSPNIAIMELTNEANQLGLMDQSTGDDEYHGNLSSSEFDGVSPASPGAFQSALTTWVDTMVTYLHKPYFYPQHLITMSYSAPIGESDHSNDYLDVWEYHNYNGSLDENAERATLPVSYFGSNVYNQPFIFGELGNSLSGCTFSIDHIQDISFHDDEWATAFISSAAGLYFGDPEEAELISCPPSTTEVYEENPIKHRKNFKALSSFFNDNSAIGALEGSGWSNENQYQNNTRRGVEYYYRIQPVTGNQIGWCHNNSVSWENTAIPNCIFKGSVYKSNYNLNSSFCYTPIAPVALNTILTFERLEQSTWYKFQLFNTYTGTWISSQSVYSTTSGDLTFRLEFASEADTTNPIDPAASQPDYAYLLTNLHMHSAVQTDSTVVVLPNDTVYLPMDSVSYKGAISIKKDHTFLWNFGNGIISSAIPYPKFIYSKIGSYFTSVQFSDSGGGNRTYVSRTYIVLDSISKFHTVSIVAQNSEINSITLVPNPTKGTFNIIAPTGETISKVEIYDVLGRLCYQKNLPKSNVFNISSFASGIYLVKIYSGSKECYRKLIKED